MSHSPAAEAAAAAARDGYGRLVALLAAADGDIAAAEDALADALERALRTWPDRGIPDKPEAWLLTVARNRQRDRWKSAEVQRTAPLDPDRDGARAVILDEVDPYAIGDHRLELMGVCAHPAIDPGVRTPLMLNVVLGFTAAEVAAAFAVPKATMATRLVRAKRRIKDTEISFDLPDRGQLPDRMEAVLEAVYGAYVIEWAAAEPQPRRLPPEAARLAEVLAELAPRDAEVRGLAALVLLSAARSPARTDPAGNFVPLADQDPARWDGRQIARAHEHLRAAHAERTLGRFQVEAAIQATHCARRPGAVADWATLKQLHTTLHRLAPTHGSATALAAVLTETDGPAQALAFLDEWVLDSVPFQPAWATRAHLLALLGRGAEAAAAYDRAIALTTRQPERDYLAGRRHPVDPERL